MKKICAVSKKEFEISAADLEFYKKMDVPPPSLCPEERQRRRISYRNFRSLYRRKCDATGKNLISMYHEKQEFPVFENSYWWGDDWDAKSFGRDFDFERNFFEQYAALANEVPRMATLNVNSENCTYSNFSWLSKNCYLVFGCVRDEDCLNGHIVWDSKNCIDNLYIFRCEWCSECVDCVDCYDTHFSTECTTCAESFFCHDCRGCKNCFGCTNLRQKEFWFLNEKCSREKYFEKLRAIQPFSRETISNGKFWLEKSKKESCIFPPFFGVKNENVSGNHVYESKDCHDCFDVKQCEDSKFLYTAHGEKNCRDISFTGATSDFCLECLAIGDANNLRFCHATNNSSNLTYCEFCYNCKNCFGCNGLRNAEFCILNKQFSKSEYETLSTKIIQKMRKTAEWGEFFPMKNSPFAYNEAIVQEYLPLKKEEILALELRWHDTPPRTEKSSFLKEDLGEFKIPEKMENIGDEILEQILSCETCENNFKIQSAELKFHRKINLPLPTICPDCRHSERMKLRNPRTLFLRECKNCAQKIKTSFSPNRTEKVLCEKCYLKKIN
ncbi:hypothetical protein HN954_02715 [bacterium]|jgi:hypothetical protein|nr:hypothetical protein [bacterium]MBT6831671.1 hypothetical protein [bacterium]MBT6996317.1 hypothetical protein [bacterium]MBT7772995.1 hypothetical protein [bacterium]